MDTMFWQCTKGWKAAFSKWLAIWNLQSCPKNVRVDTIKNWSIACYLNGVFIICTRFFITFAFFIWKKVTCRPYKWSHLSLWNGLNISFVISFPFSTRKNELRVKLTVAGNVFFFQNPHFHLKVQIFQLATNTIGYFPWSDRINCLVKGEREKDLDNYQVSFKS